MSEREVAPAHSLADSLFRRGLRSLAGMNEQALEQASAELPRSTALVGAVILRTATNAAPSMFVALLRRGSSRLRSYKSDGRGGAGARSAGPARRRPQ